MLVASTERGLVRVVLPREDFDSALERLAAGRLARGSWSSRAASTRPGGSWTSTSAASRREFDLELDWRLIRGAFTDSVLENVERGAVRQAITYGEAAARAGSPRAYRAAGNALGSNPIPIVIPCHRVVRTGGAVGGYGGGPEMKRVPPAPRGVAG